ncbi:acyl-CoA dehydrogenase family protein [Streptomyces sp. 796.1]|uniref:acyl-CoA dehydrogenase family protein n=1 Tax=Streptomyces sp. 796.1 TaxID=3163029 RepID=UPI0039C9BF9B
MATAPAGPGQGAAPAVDRLTELLDGLTADEQPYAPHRLAALDLAGAFPEAPCHVLDVFGLRQYYVPAEHGGALDDFTVVMRLLRAVSRHDLTVAASHGKTYLGAVPTWIGGTPEAARSLGRRVLAGQLVSCALTERDHGSDLLGGEVVATRTPSGGWRLTGEKWLINSATRADLVTVLARTDPAGGPRGFSLFLVDKARLAPDAYACLPKVATYGIRGADISGISFDDTPLPDEALIGEVGQGIETIVKALHLTRTGCAAMSLGAGDQALRLAATFATRPYDGDQQLFQLPQIRREFDRAAAELLLADATTLVAMRSVHALTHEMSVVSAVAKGYVPTQVDGIIARLLHLLGPYGLLGPDDPHGRFAKLERDHRIIGIFDGSSLVNRNALIEQFPRIARAYRKGRWDAAGLAEATCIDLPLRPFRGDELNLVSPTGSSLVASLPVAVADLRERAADGRASARLADLAGRLLAATDRLHAELAAVRFPPRAVPDTAFALAERFELTFAATAALHLWLNARAPHTPGRDTPTLDTRHLPTGAGPADGTTAQVTGTGPQPGPETWLHGCLLAALIDLGEPVEQAEHTIFDTLADTTVRRAPEGWPTLVDHLAPAHPREATTA